VHDLVPAQQSIEPDTTSEHGGKLMKNAVWLPLLVR